MARAPTLHWRTCHRDTLTVSRELFVLTILRRTIRRSSWCDKPKRENSLRITRSSPYGPITFAPSLDMNGSRLRRSVPGLSACEGKVIRCSRNRFASTRGTPRAASLRTVAAARPGSPDAARECRQIIHRLCATSAAVIDLLVKTGSSVIAHLVA